MPGRWVERWLIGERRAITAGHDPPRRHFGGWGGNAPFDVLGGTFPGLLMKSRVAFGSVLPGTTPGLPPPPTSHPAKKSRPPVAMMMHEIRFVFKCCSP